MKVRDTKVGRLSAVKKLKKKSASDNNHKAMESPPIAVTHANAPILHVKFLEAIAGELNKTRVELAKFNAMFGDVVKMLREQDGG